MRRILSALCLSTALGLTAALPAHAADAPITPSAPTVVDECGLGQDRVTIPEVDGVRYLVELDGETIELTPGDYAGIAFWSFDALSDEDFDDLIAGESDTWVAPDATATITVEAADGYTLADGAATSFAVSLSSAPCASGRSAVTAATDCGTVTFSNPVGNPEALVLWADADSLDDYTELVLAPGSSRTVHTDAAEVEWGALDNSLWEDEAWQGDGDRGVKAATRPDHVATEEDRAVLEDMASYLDELLAGDLGGGYVELPADCPAPVDPSDEETSQPVTPEIPAVVQTDGITQHSPLAPLALGGLSALGALLVLRPRRQN